MPPDLLVARATDPITSTPGIRTQVHTMKMQVLDAAIILGHGFNDTQLTAEVEQITGKRQQRGSVARTRKALEDEGLVMRRSVIVDGQITFDVTEGAFRLLRSVA